jgi:hypothetical protein
MPQPTNMASLRPLDWANEYTQAAVALHGDVVEPILHFSILWNLFERDACGKQASRHRVGTVVAAAAAARQISLEAFAEHLEYFQNRARRNGMLVEHYLDALRVDRKDRALVGDVLSGHRNDVRSVVHALLLVVLRIRNNLFHGEKDVAVLHTQADLFRAANSVVATYLTVTRGMRP